MEKMDREELEWYHNIQDPWDWVTVFEDTVSKYCGYKYGVIELIQTQMQSDYYYTI